MNKPNSNTNCSSNNLRVGNGLRSGTKRTREQSFASSEGDKETTYSLEKVGNECESVVSRCNLIATEKRQYHI